MRGGPGSGKTTVSILKAAQIVEQGLQAGQRVLFLSFARATISRVLEAIQQERRISELAKGKIVVETYHAFFWQVIKTHGYLFGLPRRVAVLAPAAEAVALSGIRSKYPRKNLTDSEKRGLTSDLAQERNRLATAEGLVCFDLFAAYVDQILRNSVRIGELIGSKFPVVILDEFQDTSDDQWAVIRQLGNYSRLIALADPDQRIYDWLGARPERLLQFHAEFHPIEVDLRKDNYRSSGTEILAFGDDVLSGRVRKKSYSGISIDFFEAQQDPAMAKLIATTYKARKRLSDGKVRKWSLAILVPTKKLTRIVSDAFRSPPANMKPIQHHAVIDMEGAVLGSEIVACLMLRMDDQPQFAMLVDLLQNFFLGKGGATPSKESLGEAQAIRDAYDELLEAKKFGKPSRKNNILVNTVKVFRKARDIALAGNPDGDWSSIRDVLAGGECKRLQVVAEELRNVRLLERGAALRQLLAQDWRDNDGYRNSVAIVRQAFVQDHFASSSKPESGVVVMNMHKAKGKQFDEVIIFEGWPVVSRGTVVSNLHRIVWKNSLRNVNDSARQNLRVSITRGRTYTSILTPRIDPCRLLDTR